MPEGSDDSMKLFSYFDKNPKERMEKLERTVAKLEELITKAEEPLYFTEGGMFERIAKFDGRYEVFDSNYKKGSTIALHNHSEMEIYVVVSGSMILEVQGARRMMGRGDAAMVEPLVPHSFEFPLDTNFITIAVPPLGGLNAGE